MLGASCWRPTLTRPPNTLGVHPTPVWGCRFIFYLKTMNGDVNDGDDNGNGGENDINIFNYCNRKRLGGCQWEI